jgi:serine/threonine protein kinase
VYAFGVMLVEIMAGTKPITGQTVEEIFRQILYQPLQLDALRDARLPQSVITLIERCTTKNPAERMPGFDQVTAELENIIRDPNAQPLNPPLKTTPPPPPPPPSTQPPPRKQPPPPPPPQRPIDKPPRPKQNVAKQPVGPPVATVDDPSLPDFINKLPPVLRTQQGLTLVTMAAVLLVLLVVFLCAKIISRVL